MTSVIIIEHTSLRIKLHYSITNVYSLMHNNAALGTSSKDSDPISKAVFCFLIYFPLTINIVSKNLYVTQL